MTDEQARAARGRVILAEAPEFKLADMRVIPAERAVVVGDERRELQPRVMQVLVALAEERPAVVSRDRLVERCWDGRIVGDDAVNRCVLALRQLADAFGDAPFRIETIPRVGHRLVERSGGEAIPALAVPLRRRRLAILTIAALLLAALGAGAWYWFAASREPARIAVLPFRNLSGGDAYFSEGLGEEILSQLARESGLSVVGRTSAAQFKDAADLRDVGRKLGVDYLLEGSVRREAGRIRVNASLVQASDGMRLWSQSYDRNDGDAFAIQQAVAIAVTNALQRRISAKTGNGTDSRPANNLAYTAYVEARGMLQTRNPQLGAEAIRRLQQAIKADPSYAPSWAALADAIRLEAPLRGHEAMIGALPKARAAARRALQLDPDLAAAHGVLGALMGFSSPDAQRHLRRAATLDPASAEAQLWLAAAERVSGDYRGEIAAYRRAHELDPQWFRPTRDLALAIAETGNRAEAEALVRASFSDGDVNRSAQLARIAWSYGDVEGAMRQWLARPPRDSIWNAPSQAHIAAARFTLGLQREPNPLLPLIDFRSAPGRAWLTAQPTSAQWQSWNRNADAALVYRNENVVAAKLMIQAGRSSELAASYRRPAGLLGIRPGEKLTPYHLHAVPLVALALQAAGEDAEARRLLAEAKMLLAAQRGPVPFSVEADAAAILAVAGSKAEALTMLERASRRGWAHNGTDDLLRLADEPAFASLRAEPRFTAAAKRLDDHYARERAKVVALERELGPPQ